MSKNNKNIKNIVTFGLGAFVSVVVAGSVLAEDGLVTGQQVAPSAQPQVRPVTGSKPPAKQAAAPAKAGASPSKPAAVQRKGTLVGDSSLLSELTSAYNTLSTDDHDYEGHRVAAMSDIAAAASPLGGHLNAQGGGGKTQSLSDIQIRSVEMQLLGVGRSVPAGPKHGEIADRVNAAVHQLELALQSESKPTTKTKGAAGKKTPTDAGSASVETADDTISSNSVEIASLARIYSLLSEADHDYKGHRRKAMDFIAKASRELGSPLGGDGSGDEAQAASDSQLHQALDLLGQVQSSYVGEDTKPVAADLQKAVNQLGVALKVK